MSHNDADRYRREADRLLAEMKTVSDFASQAALLERARQYLKLAAHHEALAFFHN
jgi:hypothetical protein